eukprot:514256-Pyramimonas_sp.AAC.1
MHAPGCRMHQTPFSCADLSAGPEDTSVYKVRFLKKKSYLDRKEYCVDIVARMSVNVRACERPLTGRNSKSTVRDLLS